VSFTRLNSSRSSSTSEKGRPCHSVRATSRSNWRSNRRRLASPVR
jgi:hypothetical protein